MDQAPVLFNGLRVRMGVVTGEVPSGTPIKNSALFQLAKVVGDFGNGGQIILDEATFAGECQGLGCVHSVGGENALSDNGACMCQQTMHMCATTHAHALPFHLS